MSEEESDFDADEDLEEQGMDWEDMEREAAAEDSRKSRSDEIEVEGPRGAKRRGSTGGGGKRRRR